MSDTKVAEGSCLCGAVKVSTQTMHQSVGACHCSMCRRWSSGPFLAVDCESDLNIQGAENITAYSSSDWAERAFCKSCGTHLYYRLKQNNQFIVSVSLFEDSKDLNFDHQIFIDEKPDFYDFANQTKNMTGEEVFAAFSPPSDE